MGTLATNGLIIISKMDPGEVWFVETFLGIH